MAWLLTFFFQRNKIGFRQQDAFDDPKVVHVEAVSPFTGIDQPGFPHTLFKIDNTLASWHRYPSDWNPEKFIADASQIDSVVSGYIKKVLATMFQ